MATLAGLGSASTRASSPGALERVRTYYDRRAPSYDQRVRRMERLIWGDRRSRICSQASGDVLEVAVGTGLNFAYYPPGVRLSAIELSPAMLGVAAKRAADLGLAVDLREGDAQSLPFANERFDTVLCTLALCTIPDDRRALAEAWRVLRPGGRLLLLEHVRSPRPVTRFIEGLLEPLALRFMNDHLLQDPLDHLDGLGFVIEQVEWAKLGILEWVVARKPAVTAV